MATFFKNDETGKFLAAVDADMFAPAGYTEVAANSVDAAVEKHVPVVELQREGHVLNVTVGEVEHPMEDAHYIEWIALARPPVAWRSITLSPARPRPPSSRAASRPASSTPTATSMACGRRSSKIPPRAVRPVPACSANVSTRVARA
ncbi:MAG: desulfoferrodoxin family protein [Collinsella sp.]